MEQDLGSFCDKAAFMLTQSMVGISLIKRKGPFPSNG